MSVVLAAGPEERAAAVHVAVLAEVDVGPPGHTASVEWAPVPGEDAAGVTSATATIGPALAVENAATIPFTGSGAERIVTPPAGRRVRSLTLSKLALAGGSTLTNEDQLTAAGVRIVVSLPGPHGGWASP